MKESKISSLRELKPGDHIKYDCILLDKIKKDLIAMHHALVVDVVNDVQLKVIHNTGENVEEELITMDATFITVVDYECAYSGAEAISRARERLGDGYYVLTDNCEHLVTWARTGRGRSKQVKVGFLAGTVGAAGGGTAGAIVGSMVLPGVGTAIGGMVGGTIGLVAGFRGATAYARFDNSKPKSS